MSDDLLKIISVQCACYHGNTGFSVSLATSPPSPPPFFHFPSTPERGHVTALTSSWRGRQAEGPVNLCASVSGSLSATVSSVSVTQSVFSSSPSSAVLSHPLSRSHLCFFLLLFTHCFFLCCYRRLPQTCLERKCWVMDC